MTRKLDTSLPRNPSVRLADGKIGCTFTGKLLEKRAVKFGDSESNVYEFAYVSGDAPVTKKIGDGQYEEITTNVGDTVNLFGSVVLDRGLSQAQIGETIEIKFTGRKKRTQLYDLTVVG